MREILRAMGKGFRQGLTEGFRDCLGIKQKYQTLTTQEREKSLQIAREVITVARGFLEDNNKVERIDPKGRVLKIKLGKELENKDSTEGAELMISVTEKRDGFAITYRRHESYAFYPNGTYTLKSITVEDKRGRAVEPAKTIRREANPEDLNTLLRDIKGSQPRK